MAISHVASTAAAAYSSTGTQTTSHAGGTCRAAIVIITQNASTGDQVSGVTYAGAEMARVRFDTEATEAGGVYLYFLDNVTTDTQNVAMTTTGTAAKRLSVTTVNVAASMGVGIAGHNTATSTSGANPTVTVTGLTSGDTHLGYFGLHSGLQTMTTTPGTGWTSIVNADLGSQGLAHARLTTPTSGITSLACTWTAATADDYRISAIVLKEFIPPQTLVVAGLASSRGFGAVAGSSTVSLAVPGLASSKAYGAVALTKQFPEFWGALVESGEFPAIEATGGTITLPQDGYKYHTFTALGASAFEVTAIAGGGTPRVEYLIVGGGGGGGSFGGGGGAGDPLAGSQVVSVQSYATSVGDGGAGQPTSDTAVNGVNGQSTTIFGQTAIGGGGGGSRGGASAYQGNPGSSGASGGGGANSDNAYTAAGGAATGAGYAGGAGGQGTAGTPNYAHGGGGGAGGPGEAGRSNGVNSAAGGAGFVSSISGTSKTYASGGGGGIYNNGTLVAATPGGGGRGGAYGTPATAGTANTGGGGGGGEYTGPGGKGGSGIIIVRYRSDEVLTHNDATGGTITEFVSTGQVGTTTGRRYRLHTFSTSGTFTVLTSVTAFDAIILGGSGSGRYNSPGGGGGGGKGEQWAEQFAEGAYTITIGGGTPASENSGMVFSGNPSTAFGKTGAGGNAPPSGSDGTGGFHQNLDFDGTGTQGYGINGGTFAYTIYGKYAGGGGGGAGSGNWGYGGVGGVVLIRYEIPD